jgi:hypothetical protein
MSISSILAQAVSSISPAALQQIVAATTNATGNSSPATSTSISQPGQLLSQLQQLATSNPAEFKQVTAQIATQLQAAATAASGTSGASSSAAAFLTNVANQFQQASQTGSATSLIPAHKGGGHHHHGGGGGGELASLLAASTTSSSSPSTSSSTTSSAPQLAATGYSAQSSDPFTEVLSIIQSALSSVGSSATAVAA